MSWPAPPAYTHLFNRPSKWRRRSRRRYHSSPPRYCSNKTVPSYGSWDDWELASLNGNRTFRSGSYKVLWLVHCPAATTVDHLLGFPTAALRPFNDDCCLLTMIVMMMEWKYNQQAAKSGHQWFNCKFKLAPLSAVCWVLAVLWGWYNKHFLPRL